MVKETIINPTLTPTGKTAFASGMLSGAPAQPQTRWSPGSLAVALLAASEVQLKILITSNQLVAVSGSFSLGELTGAPGVTASPVFYPDPSERKARTVSCEDFDVSNDVFSVGTTVPIGTSGIDKFVRDILEPRRPEYTALSILNAIETASYAPAYVICLDQADGSVTYVAFDTSAHADEALSSLLSGKDIEAAYLMTPPASSGSGATSYAWE